MRVGVCDFPSHYAFPPQGYGGIERWLWAVAVGARRAGADVHLLGPAWRHDLPHQYDQMPVRLEDIRPGEAGFDRLKQLDLDLLVVGHEYPSLPAWRETWAALGCDVLTFQHDPDFEHLPGAFDCTRSRLFCYSREMVERYAAHHPGQALSVQFGCGEEDPAPAIKGEDLLWLGRVDKQKAPHLAAMAAHILGRRLRIVGPVLDRSYMSEHGTVLTAPHVELVGELAGLSKLKALRAAGTLVYTCAHDYIEAGAAVFGEALRSGTAVAALTWRSGSCAEAALCHETGATVRANPDEDDQSAAVRLAAAITIAEQLDVCRVQEIGLTRFDPTTHFSRLAEFHTDA